MPAPTTTLPLRPALRSEIARLARRHCRSFSEVAQDLDYDKYPQEIDDAIEENRQLTWEVVRSRLSSVAKRA